MKFLIAICALAMMLIPVNVSAQKSSGSSKPSSRSSRLPSSGSKYSSPSSGSKYSSPSSKPSSGSKYSSPSSKPPTSSGSKYSSPLSKPPTSSGSKYSSPLSKPPTSSGSKYSSPSSKPPVNRSSTSKYFSPLTSKPVQSTTIFGNSSKPKTVENDFSRANKKEASKREYVAQQAATASPKSSYTTSTGQTVKVDAKDPRVQAIRTKPSTYYHPEVRQQRYEQHFHHYHYPQPYSYYSQQPYYHVGGGYSSAFWYMMLSWDAERRARWLYHNQDRIDQNAYNEGVRDANVAARLRALEQQNLRRDPNYVDPEFQENPVDMYDQDYIEAAYNPEISSPTYSSDTSGTSRAIWSFLFWTTIIGCGIAFFIWLLFGLKFGK